MNPFENINNPQEGQQNSPSCISELRNNIHGMIQDSRLTADEAQEINYQLSSSIDNCRAETHQEIQQSAREILKNGINIRAGEDSERRIWSYLGTDLMGIRNILLQQWIQVPDNYSIRDNEDYLVFHDENGKDIGTYNWQSHEIWSGWIFIWNDDRRDNMEARDLADSFDINQVFMNEEKAEQIQNFRENMFDANIIYEDPFDYSTSTLAAESLWISPEEFKSRIIGFQRQVVQDGYSPFQEDLWKNIWVFESRWQFIFNQQTPQWNYVWIYNRNWDFIQGWIYR